MTIDPLLINAFFHITVMMAWFYGWIRHPLMMFAGISSYFVFT
jgi:hypothetical protein